jgi:hypothetical protein
MLISYCPQNHIVVKTGEMLLLNNSLETILNNNGFTMKPRTLFTTPLSQTFGLRIITDSLEHILGMIVICNIGITMEQNQNFSMEKIKHLPLKLSMITMSAQLMLIKTKRIKSGTLNTAGKTSDHN